MGRPRAIQGEIERRLLEALERGLTIKLACQYAGVSQDAWERKRNSDADFAERATRARLKHLPEALDLIRRHANDDWRAAKAFIDLVAPDDYSRQRLEITGQDGAPLKFTLNISAPDDAER